MAGPGCGSRSLPQNESDQESGSGEGLTAAVTKAVRERLDRVRQAQGISLGDQLLAIGKDCAAHLKKPFRTIDHGKMLYDERGLPK